MTCETRFVEQHYLILVFHKRLDALEQIQKVADRKAAGIERSLFRTLTDPTFFVAESHGCDISTFSVLAESQPRPIPQWRCGECEAEMDEWDRGPYGSFVAAPRT